jgi:hypothetical protein
MGGMLTILQQIFQLLALLELPRLYPKIQTSLRQMPENLFLFR